MGSTSAQVTKSPTDESAAFVSCGADFCRIAYAADGLRILEIDSVWFSDRLDPGYSQSPVAATCQIPLLPDSQTIGRSLSGFLFAASGDRLLFAQLESDQHRSRPNAWSQTQHFSKAVPRKLLTYAKPTNAVYMKSLRKIVVSTIEAREERASPDGYRLLHSAISLIHVSGETPPYELEVKQQMSQQLATNLTVARYNLKHAERVYSIVEWPYEDNNGKRYCLVILGTGITVGPGEERGRRLIFNAGKSGSKLDLQKESNYDQPVYCIAMYGTRATVSVIGRILSFDEYDAKAGRQVLHFSVTRLFLLMVCRWIRRGARQLPSIGTHVTVSGTYIYISTLQHSHICYEVIPCPIDNQIRFEQVFTDSRERSCTHHIVVDIEHFGYEQSPQTMVLLTDKTSATVSCLSHPVDRTYKNATNTVFEACLPRTVVRLQRGNVRPPWRYPNSANRQGHVPGILADDIIGACSDGTIYAFSILSEPARHLLRFLQNLIQVKETRDTASRFTLVKPRSGDIFKILMNGAGVAQDDEVRARDVDPRYQDHVAAAPRSKHIDGDVLLRFFTEKGNLEKLLSVGTNRDVAALFRELSVPILPLISGVEHLASPSIYTASEAWLSQVLTPL